MPECLVVFSFGGDVGRYGKANKALAKLAHSIWKSKYILVYAEGFVTYALKQQDFHPDFDLHSSGRPSEPVDMQAMIKDLSERGVDKVYLLAHPFLYWAKYKDLLKQAGFTVIVVSTGWIPFDRECSRWQFRSLLHMSWYAFLRLFTFSR